MTATPPDAPSPLAAGRATARGRSDPSDHYETHPPFRAMQCFVSAYGRAFQHVHPHNACPIPPTGPALIASNHTAGLDPMAIQALCPRIIVWVMTHEYYDVWPLRPLMQWTQMVRIDREGKDSGAWREALRHLKRGRVVGVFPEGRIERDGTLLPFQTGAALLAMRGGADVFPVYLDGRQRNTSMTAAYFRRNSPSVAWGRPVVVPPGKPAPGQLDSLTATIQSRVEALRQHYPAPRQHGRAMLA